MNLSTVADLKHLHVVVGYYCKQKYQNLDLMSLHKVAYLEHHNLLVGYYCKQKY